MFIFTRLKGADVVSPPSILPALDRNGVGDGFYYGVEAVGVFLAKDDPIVTTVTSPYLNSTHDVCFHFWYSHAVRSDGDGLPACWHCSFFFFFFKMENWISQTVSSLNEMSGQENVWELINPSRGETPVWSEGQTRVRSHDGANFKVRRCFAMLYILLFIAFCRLADCLQCQSRGDAGRRPARILCVRRRHLGGYHGLPSHAGVGEADSRLLLTSKACSPISACILLAILPDVVAHF